MEIAALVLSAAVGLGQVHVGGKCAGDECYLATPRAYPTNMVDGVRRPGFNGRMYVRRPIIGGQLGPYASVHGQPGPEAYGAYGSEGEIVWARVDHQAIPLDPFSRLPRGMKHQEEARQRWLEREGYVGGVRTHVNDLYVFGADEKDEMASKPTPRATIRVPEHWRRTPTLQVRGGDVRPAVHIAEASWASVDRRPVVRMDEPVMAEARRD